MHFMAMKKPRKVSGFVICSYFKDSLDVLTKEVKGMYKLWIKTIQTSNWQGIFVVIVNQ